MKQKSIRVTLLTIIVPLVIAIFASIGFFSARLNSMNADDKVLYYDKLYNINAMLIGADRDFYRAMLAADQYHLQYEILSASDLEERANIYKENKQSALEQVEAAAAIAMTDESLFTGTTLEDSENTFSDHYDTFESDFGFWDSMYDIDEDRGFWSNYCGQFEITRGVLGDMIAVTEVWANRQVETQKARVK
ncbi:MAG: hypothetical protein K6E68_01960 [Lachnospiraceae bacterium]|nr:hypothetical protein [Lachnospiraceae bacterium]